MDNTKYRVGLKSYECEMCGDSFQVQFEREEPYESDDDYYEPPYDSEVH